jgi:hypothetical protein
VKVTSLTISKEDFFAFKDTMDPLGRLRAHSLDELDLVEAFHDAHGKDSWMRMGTFSCEMKPGDWVARKLGGPVHEFVARTSRKPEPVVPQGILIARKQDPATLQDYDPKPMLVLWFR